jgi:4-amino-4-deoxy-L-arabinose transferase-like glycosyltransferase
VQLPVQLTSPDPHQEAEPLSPKPVLFWWVLIGLIFVVGLAIRFDRLGDPPVDFHPTRQLHSALIARGMYLANNSSVPAWQRQMAVDQWHMEGQIEPQVFERLTAWTYQVTGTVDLRIPRLYAILFWMAAAICVTGLAWKITGRGGALVATLFFLILPYGVVASRAFQPEPLMIALMVAGLWAAICWRQRDENQSRFRWAWVVSGGLLCGLAIYIKSVAVFFIAPALAVIVLARPRPLKVIRDPQVWILAALAVLPYGMYLVDGVYLRGYLVGQFSDRFFPEMWIDPAFYLRWISNLGHAVPIEMILVAMIGAFLVRNKTHRALLLAMWVGYFVYGMTLPHHISTHDYYHLPLFPLVALGLGSVAETIFRNIQGPRWLAHLAVTVVFIAALVIEGYNAHTVLKRSGAVAQAQIWEAAGQALGPGASAIALVDDYGTGLKYWAWINPAIWPTADDIRWQESNGQSFDFKAFFDKQAAGKDFFVIALFDELDRQSDLKEVLSSYSVFRQGPGYLIYDLRSRKANPGTP